MNSIESELFEEFKRVDAICGDMFSAQYGVTAYIEQMEMTPMSMQYRVAGWDDDYKQLKHIRWVRNQLAHSTNYVERTQADVDWLRNFHDRLLNRTDPLSMVEQFKRGVQASRVKSKPQKTIPTVTPIVCTNNTKPKNKALPVIIAIACAAVAAALIVFLFWFINTYSS